MFNNNYLLNQFYLRCQSLSLRPQSILQYKKVLFRFCRFYEAESVDANGIREYLASLKVAPVTRKIHYMVLNVFFNYISKMHFIQNNPMTEVERPRVPKKRMKYFSSEEISEIIECWDENTFFGIRNKTIMLLFFQTGIRRSEMSNLNLTDVRWDLNVMFIKGKGGAEREIPLTEATRRVLVKYISRRSRFVKERKTYVNDALFISTNNGERLTPAGIWNIFKKSPLTGEAVSPHTWRRTFAREFLINGGDLVSLQLILGHSDINMTRKYVYLANDDLKNSMEKHAPKYYKKFY